MWLLILLHIVKVRKEGKKNFIQNAKLSPVRFRIRCHLKILNLICQFTSQEGQVGQGTAQQSHSIGRVLLVQYTNKIYISASRFRDSFTLATDDTSLSFTSHSLLPFPGSERATCTYHRQTEGESSCWKNLKSVSPETTIAVSDIRQFSVSMTTVLGCTTCSLLPLAPKEMWFSDFI